MKFYRTQKYFLSIAFVCLLALACKEKKDASKNGFSKKPTPSLEGYIIKTESYSDLIEVPGTVVANEVTEIHPEVSGRVVHLNIAEGKTVGKGTLLAKIYDGDLQAQLKKLNSQLAIAKSNENRASQLLKIQGISKNDYDVTLLNLNNILADIHLIKTEISRTEVRAPFSGRLGLKNISSGAYITPASVIATINQMSEMKLDFSIPEKYLGSVGVGQVVHFTIQGSDHDYSAKVYATESNVEINNRSLMLRAKVFGKTDGLMPGAFAKVKIGFIPNAHAVFVPSQAVFPTAKGKQVVLFRDGKAIFNDVEIGIRDSARVEITRGVKVGDTILASGLMTTKPNAEVKISKIIP